MPPTAFVAEHPPDSTAFRARLRREKRAARAALAANPAEHAALSAQIEAHLEHWLLAREPASLGFCAALRGEFDAAPLVARLLTVGWQAAMPVVVTPHAPMQFRGWTPATPMTLDRHGIPIPNSPETGVPEILLLPLVAFDAARYRLGYGGGYFDRTLAACVPRPYALGVGFELARVPSVLPQAHDQACDAIVTETGLR
jgi:5,10-methenyltetrahydrofolate synthetase